MKKGINFLLISLLFNLVGVAQQNALPTFITDSIDAYVEQALLDWNIPGVAVGIVKNGEIVLEKGYGIANLDTKAKVDNNTLFMIGSNTKAFTGTLLALMEHEKQLSLNDKVIKYVPSFKMYDANITKEVNLIDIVSHRLGFQTFQGDFMYFDSDLSDEQMFVQISKVKPMFDFRTKWGYCNAGYFVAGECIQSITGKEWGAYMKERIFTPTQMSNTFTAVADIKVADNACAAHSLVKHKLTTIPYGGLDLLGPAASISSSIHDMNKWTTMLLDSGRYENINVLPQAVIKRTRKPESIVGKGRHPFNKSNYRLYGLGWNLTDYESHEIVAHTGGIHGFVTSVTLVPEFELGIVVLTNTDNNWFYEALKWEIVDAYLELPYRNYSKMWSDTYKQRAKADSMHIASLKDSVVMNIKPDFLIKNLAGKYTSNVYGNVEIVVEKKVTTLKLEHHPEITGKLEYIGNRRFLCTYSNPQTGINVFPFVITDGEVKSFTLSVNSQLEFTTYEFNRIEE